VYLDLRPAVRLHKLQLLATPANRG
jgi:hypothetical protein